MSESVSFVTGTIPFSEYDAYVSALNKMNLQELLNSLGVGKVLYASAIDERIKCTFISGYLCGFKDNNCSCNYIPSLWFYFVIQDIAALIAPRALIIQSAEQDHLA